MIIFGTKVKHKTIGEGEFFCPKCQTINHYIHKQAIRSFTLYFIPLFPIQRLGEFIECQGCGVTFKPEVRHMRGKPSRQSNEKNVGTLISSIKSRLDAGYPIEYMVRDLTAAGLDLAVARGAVEGAVGANRKTCEKCSLAYSSTASTCTGCGGVLR